MLGLVLIYFVGKAFYDLAIKFDKSKWLFAILGVVSYYAGLWTSALIIGVFIGYYSPELLDSPYDLLLGIAAIPFGVLTCYIFYQILKKSWTTQPNKVTNLNEMVNDFGRKNEDGNFEN